MASSQTGNGHHRQMSKQHKQVPRTKKSKVPAIKALTPEPVEPVSKLGLTQAGKPRQRAYKTYYGVTDAGRLIKYKNYEAREIDVKEGRVKRVTRQEAATIEAEGARPAPLIVSTQWSPKAGGAQSPQASPSTDPRLIQIEAMLKAVMAMTTELASRVADLKQEEE